MWGGVCEGMKVSVWGGVCEDMKVCVGRSV